MDESPGVVLTRSKERGKVGSRVRREGGRLRWEGRTGKSKGRQARFVMRRMRDEEVVPVVSEEVKGKRLG